jgi:hypothetical protein
LLILSAKTATDYAGQVAAANQLNFVDVQERLQSDLTPAQFDGLRASLDRDFRLLEYLVRHAAEFRVAGQALEQRMLILDYRLMRVWYSLSRSFSNLHSRKALEEMSQIVGHFANAVGERVAYTAQS